MPTCLKCPGRQFINDEALRMHNKSGKHKVCTLCAKCGKGFPSQQALEQHTSDKHSAFECRFCDREFMTEDGRLAHVQAKHPPMFECEHCDREFTTDEGRLTHQKFKHPGFSCRFCDREFSSEESREQHEDAKHLTYECNYCDKKFTTGDGRDAHEEAKHPTFECRFCDSKFTSADACQQHEGASHRKRIACFLCDRFFTCEEALLQHERAKHHIEPAPLLYTPQIQCVFCSSKFSTQGAKGEHEQTCSSNPANCRPTPLRTGFMLVTEPRSTDTIGEESLDDGQVSTASPSRSSHSTIDEDLFHTPSGTSSTDATSEETVNAQSCLCTLCSRGRASSRSPNADKPVLDDTENAVAGDHEDDSTGHPTNHLPCPLCVKSFDSAEALQNHACVPHTAMKLQPHCLVCYCQFEDEPSLQKHLDGPELRCQFCDIRCCSTEMMQDHLLTHPTCGKCDRSFADNISLSMHVASDHPIVVCWDCDGEVVEGNNLESHYRDSPVHPTCSRCGTGQRDADELDKHVTRVHGTAEIEADTSHDPGACGSPRPPTTREVILAELLELARTRPSSILKSGPLIPRDEEETHVEPIDPPPQPPTASEPVTAVNRLDADVRRYASPSPTPSEHGSNPSLLHSPVACQTIRSGAGSGSPGSSATSASFSESATSDENSVVLVSADGIPEYVRENRAVLVATSARKRSGSESSGRPLRLSSQSSLESLDAVARPTMTAGLPAYRLHCRICLRDPCEDMTATICGHLFCKRCITQAVVAKSECPVCQSATLLYCLFKLDLSA